jgi:hypothetical protein
MTMHIVWVIAWVAVIGCMNEFWTFPMINWLIDRHAWKKEHGRS